MVNNGIDKKELTTPVSWKEAGNEFFATGHYEDATRCYAHAIELDPGYIDAWNNLGYALLKLGRVDEARQCNEKIRELKAAITIPKKFPDPPSQEYLARESGPPRAGPSGRLKNPTLAVIFSVCIPGLGQVYNGDTGKGILFLIGTLVGTFIFFIPGLIIWLYGMYDAHNVAKRINAGELPFKERNIAIMVIFSVIAIMIIFLAVVLVVTAMAVMMGMPGITPAPSNVIPYTPPSRIELLEYSIDKDTTRRLWVNGKLRNAGNQSASVDVIVKFYDDSGTYVDRGWTYVPDIDPGEFASFSVFGPYIDINNKIARYSIEFNDQAYSSPVNPSLYSTVIATPTPAIPGRYLIQVTSKTSWSGEYGDCCVKYSRSDTGSGGYYLESPRERVWARFYKTSGTDGILTLEIIKDGVVLDSDTTTVPYGSVEVTKWI